MVVMILENVPEGLRGELSRWLIEPSTGVFVGKISALVREQLWQHCTSKLRSGGMVQLFTMNNEQGFAIRMFGNVKRKLQDFEGLQLIKVLKSN